MKIGAENPFRLDLEIRKEDIDGLGHVNNVVYVRWIQEAAESHWDRLTAGSPPDGVVWVVLRHEIDYRLPVRPYDRVHALTWVAETAGVRSVRHVRILNSDARVVAEARTTWCLVDAATGQPRRITADILALLSR
jgi:acyl-CoA thioester hydrolase